MVETWRKYRFGIAEPPGMGRAIHDFLEHLGTFQLLPNSLLPVTHNSDVPCRQGAGVAWLKL